MEHTTGGSHHDQLIARPDRRLDMVSRDSYMPVLVVEDRNTVIKARCTPRQVAGRWPDVPSVRAGRFLMLVTIIPWVCSALALASIYLMGNRSLWGPGIALSGQLPFFIYIALTDAWGFVPASVVATILHARNFWKWHRERGSATTAS